MKKISILISKECFGNCLGCYLDPRSGKELSLDELNFFARILKNLGYEGITLSGGDPLRRKDIIDIINLFHSQKFDIHLDTTGNPFLIEDFLKEFINNKINKKVSLIGIPFDGSNDEVIQKFRTGWIGMKKNLEEILENFSKSDFRVSINTVVHNGNKNDLNNIYKIIFHYPCVKRWELHQFVSLSEKSLAVKDTLFISETVFEESIQKVIDNKGVQIDPKPSTKKQNFKYLDFNGDLIHVQDGIRNLLCNIRNSSSEVIEECLLK